ncbi:MAG: hypothetical protein ACLGJC_09655 [Alphaproteobacteria bacterium]
MALRLTPYPRSSSGSKSTRSGRIGDTMSYEGATELAARIQDHWQGYPVGVRVEPIPKVDGGSVGYCVRSNLLNGLPPR